MTRPRVLVAEDDRLIREALTHLLAEECSVVAAVEHGQAELAAIETRPDIVLFNISMSPLGGLSSASRMLRGAPGLKAIILAMADDPEMAAEAFRIGASGYLVKQSSAAELIQAVKELALGRAYISPVVTRDLVNELLKSNHLAKKPETLSDRQKEVLSLLVKGMTMKEIARSLDISSRTVAFHKYKMMETLGLGSSAELIQYACSRQPTACPTV
jgi:DNA-binding NarL/FixJ family response regulator